MNDILTDEEVAQMVSELSAEDKLLLLRVLIELDRNSVD
jgi:hypothetical protein